MKKRVLNIFSILATAALGLAASNATAQVTTNYTSAGKFTFTVPVGVTTLTVDVVGGVGGNADGATAGLNPGGGTGGAAGETQATFTVTPGDVDTIYVAQNGPSHIYTGSIPGGSGYGIGGGYSESGDGGGGGASAFINPTGLPLIVAGGGGGGGANNIGGSNGGKGGDGGSVTGTATNGMDADGDGTSGGFGATQSSNGVQGSSTAQGNPGSGANGGNSDAIYSTGGGGGAGYYGGGSGVLSTNSPYDNGGGGGGSSFADPSTSSITYGTNTTGIPYVSIAYTLPPVGAALNYNTNDNNYVNVADNPALDFGAGDFTVEASVQLGGSQSDYSGLVVKEDQNGGAIVGWQMVIVNNSLAAEFTDGNTSFGAGGGPLQGTINLNDGKWHHVAMVVNRVLHTITLYVDGKVDVSYTDNLISTMNITNQDDMLMGVERTYARFFNGNEDEVRVWNRALCKQEIVSDTNGELKLPQTGLVAYYKFDQGLAALNNDTITTLVDSSGYQLNGILNNFALTAGTISNFVTPGITANGNYAPVFATPTVKITGASSTCGGTGITLTAVASNASSYLWSDGSTGSYSSVLFPTASTGDTVAVTGSTGCMVYAAQGIAVAIPTASAINIGTYAPNYKFKGSIETTSGHYSFDTTNVAGCDSLINLYITFYNQPVVTTSSSCTPAKLTLSGNPLPELIKWKRNGNTIVTDTAKWDTGKLYAQNGLTNANGIAMDTAGNIYVANNSTDVVKYPKNATPATKGVVVARNGIAVIEDIKVDIAGNIFVVDYSNDQVYKYPAFSDSTTSPQVVASGFQYPDFMFVDNADNIYVSDDNNGCVWYYPEGDTLGTIVAQNGLSEPSGLFVDNANNLYVGDYNNDNVTEYPKGSNASTSGTIVAQGNMPNIYNSDGVNAITVDGNGYIYAMAESYNLVTNNDSAIIYIFAPGSSASTNAMDSILMPGMLSDYYFANDASGNFYAASSFNQYVKKFSNTIKMTDSVTMGGTFLAQVTSFSGSTFNTAPIVLGEHTASAITVGTYASSYKFKGNTETASGHYTFDTTNVSGCDSVVNLYLTMYNQPVVTTSSTCVPAQLTVSGYPLPYMLSWTNGITDTAKWDTMGTVIAQNGIASTGYGIAIDTAGNIYVANNNTDVVKYPKNSTPATKGIVVARNGISSIEDVKVDIAGNIFVEDYFNDQVYKYPAFSDSTTAPVVVASGFSQPEDLFVDNADNIYVSDNSIAGVWYYPAGDTTGTIIAQNGISGVAAMYVDNASNLYVSDYNNNNVTLYPKGSNASTPGTIVAQGNMPNIIDVDGLWDITVDGSGYIYAMLQSDASPTNNDSAIVYVFAPGSNQNSLAIDSIIMPGMYQSYYMATDANGDFYASTTIGNYVKKFSNIIKLTDSVKTGGKYGVFVTAFSGSNFKSTLLTLGAPDTSILNKVACDSYTLNGTKYTSGGTFTQVLANKAGCDSTITLNLTVNTTPTVTVTGKDTVLLGGNDTLKASGATTYTWTTGGTNDTIIVSPSTPTTYTVTGTSNGCSSNTSFTVDVEITTGVQAIANGGSVNLYPNPANTYVNISIDNGQLAMNGEVSIYNEAGKQVTPSFVIRNSQFVIDINDLSAGVYFVRINTATQSQVVRFIKSK